MKENEYCDAMGHFGGDPTDNICPKCGRPYDFSDSKEEPLPPSAASENKYKPEGEEGMEQDAAFYCQSHIEDRGICIHQCEHCRDYYAPLEPEEWEAKFISWYYGFREAPSLSIIVDHIKRYALSGLRSQNASLVEQIEQLKKENERLREIDKTREGLISAYKKENNWLQEENTRLSSQLK
jgi:hypothetical protein